MKMQAKLVSVVGVAVVACSLGVALAQSKKEPVFVESEKAEFKEIVPGVKKKILWGNHDKGPYGAFTKFDPGLTNPLHTHTNEVRIVVLKGAYIYKPQNGNERRVGVGSYFSIPGGDRAREQWRSRRKARSSTRSRQGSSTSRSWIKKTRSKWSGST